MNEPASSCTVGDWQDESSSAAALDRVLDDAGLWKVYHEVSGVLIQPRPCQSDQRGLRIDRILVPAEKLLENGWTHGVVGIEIKRSGVKIGPPIAQLMDYSRGVWELPGTGGIRVSCDWVFLWPAEPQHGPLASVLAQNRIGCARSAPWIRLQLKSGEQNLLRVDADGTVRIGEGAAGQKVGSR